MTLSIMNQFLSSVDPAIIWVCVATLVICCIMALIKKAIIIGVVVAILALGCTYLIPLAKDFQQNYNIGINTDSGSLDIIVDGKEFSFGGEDEEDEDLPHISNIEVTRTPEGEYTVNIKYDNGGIYNFKVPGFMRDTVLKYIDDNDFEFKLIE